jgi:hypothetical protein
VHDEIAKALACFHKQVGPILKSRSADRYKYADLATVLEAVRKPLADNGLSLVQLFEGEVLVTRLLHVSGQSIDSAIPLMRLEARGINALQALGSSISYLRRYSVLALLSLASEDDDGATAASVPSEASRRPGKAPQSDVADGVPF